jgi:hypothetical protein
MGVMGHARRRTGFFIRPATMMGQAGAGSSRTDQPQGTPPGGQRGLGSLSLPAPACQHPDQAPKPASQRGVLRTRGRRGRVAGWAGVPAPRRPARRLAATQLREWYGRQLARACGSRRPLPGTGDHSAPATTRAKPPVRGNASDRLRPDGRRYGSSGQAPARTPRRSRSLLP